jgi:hypothetical protein
MIPRLTKSKETILRIHSSLELGRYQRLTVLANRESSSLARIVKLAVIEFLDRHLPVEVTTSDGPKQASERGAGDHGA